jgi:ketosteroid isomerase-like protein
MYRFLVRRRIKWLFAEANRGNWTAIVDGLSEQFTYRFVGDTPLGGVRTTRAAMIAWWERLYRLFPDAKFKVEMIVIEGPPWNTRIMTYVKILATQPSCANGSKPYENEFMQLMQLRWGRITSVVTIEDTLRFAALLPKLSTAGIADATALPITDVKGA